ncbi:hypothetical protein L218DRAFT_988821 [Marasmius fiardii PR-910]|nr:hypothetical protein L218DRAFT_988821 [Marasmius fiardii PR-910]
MCILTVINYRSNTSVFYMSIPTAYGHPWFRVKMRPLLSVLIKPRQKECEWNATPENPVELTWYEATPVEARELLCFLLWKEDREVISSVYGAFAEQLKEAKPWNRHSYLYVSVGSHGDHGITLHMALPFPHNGRIVKLTGAVPQRASPTDGANFVIKNWSQLKFKRLYYRM